MKIRPLSGALVSVCLLLGPVWAGEAPEMDESLPLFAFSRVSNAIPADGEESILALSLGVGMTFEPQSSGGAAHTLGVRALWIPDAPRNPLDDDSPEVGSAWGPVVDWQLILSPQKRISFYGSVGLGFVYGRPTERIYSSSHGESHQHLSALHLADPDEVEDDNKNQVIPIFEVGLGLRVLTPKLSASGLRIYVAPEIGIVPGILAPYGALTIGIL